MYEHFFTFRVAQNPTIVDGSTSAPFISSSFTFEQNLVKVRSDIPNSLATLLIDLCFNFTSLAARSITLGGVLPYSVFLL